MNESEVAARVARCRKLATLLDGAWGIPYTRVRFGVDSLFGLLPVAGDLVGALMGLGIIWQARQLSAPSALQLRMLGNLGIDFALGSIPLVGDVFDVAFKKNLRNVALLEAWVARQAVLRSAMGTRG